MDTKITDLIRTHAAPMSELGGVTFATTIGSKQRFNISLAKMNSFMDEYCSLAYDDEESAEDDKNPSRFGLNLAEVTTDKIPIMVNMAFRFELKESHRDDPELYPEMFLRFCAHSIQSSIIELYNVDADMKQLLCIVLQSKAWNVGTVTHLRMRFHFPYTRIDIGAFNRTIKPSIIRMLRSKKVINAMHIHPVGDWDAIIEDIKDGVVPMYRSKIDPSHCPLIKTNNYTYINEENVLVEGACDIKLEEIFNPLTHSYFSTGIMTNSVLLKDVERSYWLPLFLSINCYSVITTPKISEVTELGSPTSAASSIIDTEDVSTKDGRKLCIRLLPLLSVDRFNSEPFWMDVGRVLYNTFSGSEEGLDLWIQHSRRATVDHREQADCESKYSLSRGSPLTWRTIAWYAKQDSPTEYENWHNSWCAPIFNEALSCIHDDVAEAIWRVFYLEYMCSGMTKNSWYRFSGHNLKPLDDAVYLRTDITEKFVPIFKEQRAQLSRDALTETKETDRKGVEIKIKQIGELIKKLGTQGYRTSVVNICREKFYVQDFEKYQDADSTRTGWSNCVIECCGNQAYPRAGKPEDYITMCTSIPYLRHFTYKHPLIEELMTWLQQCFPDKDLLNYFLKDSASMLIGRNSEKMFRAWVGSGNNSKSMIVKLFQATLGVYCIDFPTDMLMKSMSRTSGPTPELAQTRGAHMGIIAEPDETDDIQAGKIKRYTGGDRFFARMCNQNGGSIENFVKLIYMANHIPNIVGADGATYDRVQILPFLSTWVKEGFSPDVKVQMEERKFPMNPFFDQRIPDLAAPFVWLMVEYYSVYRREGLKPPRIVREVTEQHWKDTDPYVNFIHDSIEYAYEPGDGKTEPRRDEKSTLCVTDIYSTFKAWYRENRPGSDPVPKDLFSKHMKQSGRLGPQNGRKQWTGVRIKAKPMTVIPS